MAVLQGADSAPNALVIRANNREYYSHGIQTVVGFDAHTAALRHSVEAGLRFTQDQEDRFQHDDAYQMAAGRMALTRAGAPGSNANRLSHAEAWAFFVEDRIAWGRLRLAPGLRYETIDLTRTDYAATDPGRTAPRPAVANAVDVWIPGLGVSLDLRPQLDAFAGVHRGFAPPGPGSTEQTEAEQAWNYELGLRAHAGAFRAELVGFYNDYENILGRDTLSTGGSGSGDLFNGGAVRASGLEALVGYDLRKPFGLESLSVPVRINYTLSRAEFRSSFASGFEPWGTVEAGDELPYLPRHQAFASVGLEARAWSVALDAHYVSRMRTVAGRGEVLTTRATDAHLVVSASADYAVTSRARVFATVQNLTDRVYVVARQPAGARPGLPRTVMAGIKLGLGE
jgi:Fe(3+) dicitrate transport protein